MAGRRLTWPSWVAKHPSGGGLKRQQSVLSVGSPSSPTQAGAVICISSSGPSDHAHLDNSLPLVIWQLFHTINYYISHFQILLLYFTASCRWGVAEFSRSPAACGQDIYIYMFLYKCIIFSVYLYIAKFSVPISVLLAQREQQQQQQRLSATLLQ